jgi:hypothetical protein
MQRRELREKVMVVIKIGSAFEKKRCQVSTNFWLFLRLLSLSQNISQ